MKSELVFFTFQTNAKNLAVPPHTHSCYELVYYVKGNGTTIVDKKEHEFSAGTFALILPNILHSEQTQQESELIFFGFRCTDLFFRIEPRVYSDTPESTILSILLRMKDELNDKKAYYRERMNCYVSEVLIEWARQFQKAETRGDDKFAYVINYINENYHNEIDFHKLSQTYCLSYHRFRHLFKESTGFSPAQFVLQTRLRNAREMLKVEKNSITDVAYSCGFSNPSQFSTLFSCSFGMSPTKFRAAGGNWASAK